jgi:hypothetical protein
LDWRRAKAETINGKAIRLLSARNSLAAGDEGVVRDAIGSR